ncbi:MAG: ABC transporter ATP-binding protein [Candidatus Kariarchaeaceae archaeon]
MTEKTTIDHSESPELFAIFPILKRDRNRNYTLSLDLEKSLFQKINTFNDRLMARMLKLVPFISKKIFKAQTNELNMFLITFTKFNPIISLELQDRIDVENNLTRRYDKYLKNIVRSVKNDAKSDTEMKIASKIFREFAKVFSCSELKTIANMDHQQVLSDFGQKYENIIRTSTAFLWDFPGFAADRIVTSHGVADDLFYDNSKDKISGSIGEIADELALLILSSKYLNQVLPAIEQAYNYLKDFLANIANAEDCFSAFQSEKKKTITKEFFSAILGKLLGAREFLQVTQRQIERLATVEKEFKDEALSMGSQKLVDFADNFVSNEKLEKSLSLVKELIEYNTSFIEPMRNLAYKIDLAAIDSTFSCPEIVETMAYFVNSYYVVEELRFLSDQFEDIQFFTSRKGDVAFEADMGQIYQPKKGSILTARDLFRTYELARNTVYALRGVDLDIREGEFIAITGTSGAGKTTLINILSGLDQPDRGAVFIRELNLALMNDNELTDLRRKEVGFIFQSYNLIPFLQSRENVALPAQFQWEDKGTMETADQLMKDVGLEDFKTQFPNLLSGGQMQRVTIARALMNHPSIIFADEPTGDLDSITGEQIVQLLEAFHKRGSTIVLVTHDPEIAKRADREIKIEDGQVVE